MNQKRRKMSNLKNDLLRRAADMSDFVKRLRRASLTEFGLDIDKELLDEAADEIERLQKEWVSLYGSERMRFEAVQRMTAEIERLRAEVEYWKGFVPVAVLRDFPYDPARGEGK
jgi:hypothetical protein